MSIIYEPKGAAREYSPLAFNPYRGCSNGCKYCYMPAILRIPREEFLNVSVRDKIVKKFEKDCKKFSGKCGQVLITFSSDPYNELEKEERITRECLEIALENKIPISILSKNGLVLRDLDIIKKFGENIQVGMTLTFSNFRDSLHWESYASIAESRIETLKTLKENGIKTWASFEPVIIPEKSLIMMEAVLDYVDVYKIGKLNNYKGLDKKIDWTDFLRKTVIILRRGNKAFYVKEALRKAATSIELHTDEVLMDQFNLRKWKD